MHPQRLLLLLAAVALALLGGQQASAFVLPPPPPASPQRLAAAPANKEVSGPSSTHPPTHPQAQPTHNTQQNTGPALLEAVGSTTLYRGDGKEAKFADLWKNEKRNGANILVFLRHFG